MKIVTHKTLTIELQCSADVKLMRALAHIATSTELAAACGNEVTLVQATAFIASLAKHTEGC